MERTFVIGDREKNEWLAVFNPVDRLMSFCNELEKAKAFGDPEEAFDQLRQMQKTGYFTDLGIYLVQDGKAYIAGERDNYHPVD
ncbi:MAG: hypothetical protein J5548_03960 [Prevotella sp.]|nr:hypothetical protein [Prevotella sp.]